METFSQPPWVELILKRNYCGAVEGFGADGGLGVARAHADLAAVYRQGALIAAQSLIQTYAETPQDTDPAGVHHLLSVSYAIVDSMDKARASTQKMDGVEDGTGPWRGVWEQWIQLPDDSRTTPLDFANGPLVLGGSSYGGVAAC